MRANVKLDYVVKIEMNESNQMTGKLNSCFCNDFPRSSNVLFSLCLRWATTNRAAYNELLYVHVVFALNERTIVICNAICSRGTQLLGQ